MELPGDLVLATIFLAKKYTSGDVITLLLTGKIGKVQKFWLTQWTKLPLFFQNWSLINMREFWLRTTLIFRSEQFGRISRRRMGWVKYVQRHRVLDARISMTISYFQVFSNIFCGWGEGVCGDSAERRWSEKPRESHGPRKGNAIFRVAPQLTERLKEAK